eukprot:scaffold1403_cov68-Phaeocystis_antarctica.AAC.4
MRTGAALQRAGARFPDTTAKRSPFCCRANGTKQRTCSLGKGNVRDSAKHPCILGTGTVAVLLADMWVHFIGRPGTVDTPFVPEHIPRRRARVRAQIEDMRILRDPVAS